MTGIDGWFVIAGTPHSPAGFVLLGLVVGYLSGLFGVGGGFMLTPLLNSLFGIPFNIAVGSGLCQMIGASATAVLRYRQQGAVDFKLAVTIAGGMLTGVVAGARLVHALGAIGTVTVAGRELPLLQVEMDVFFMALLSWIAVTIFGEQGRQGGLPPLYPRSIQRLLPPGAGPGPYEDFTGAHLRRVSMPALSYLGLGVGLLTGMLGVGGGVILFPLLVYGLGVPNTVAIGTSLVLIFLSAAVGTVAHALQGNVYLPLAFAMLLGSTLGAQFGALSAARFKGERLRGWFGCLVVATAALLARDLVNVLLGRS